MMCVVHALDDIEVKLDLRRRMWEYRKRKDNSEIVQDGCGS